MFDRDTLVQAHEDVYASVAKLVAELDGADWDRPTGCPGWTVRDQVAHIASLEGLLAGDPFPADHRLPDDLPHVRDDVGRFMETLIDVRRGKPIDELVAELHDVTARRRAQLAAITDLAETGPSIVAGEQPHHRSLPIRVIDLYLHEQDIRRAVGRPGHTDGPAPTVVLDRMTKGLQATLPERVGRGGRVVFEVTGGAGRTIAVELGDGEAAARIAVTVPQFVALVGGRADAPSVDDLEVQGDRDLAAAALRAAGLTP